MVILLFKSTVLYKWWGENLGCKEGWKGDNTSRGLIFTKFSDQKIEQNPEVGSWWGFCRREIWVHTCLSWREGSSGEEELNVKKTTDGAKTWEDKKDGSRSLEKGRLESSGDAPFSGTLGILALESSGLHTMDLVWC